jgi:protein-arginine kinase
LNAERLALCCRSGVENPDSRIGCYILQPDDLYELEEFFGPLIRDCQGVSLENKQVSDWNLRELYDVSTLGLPPLSMRVRVARNVKSFHMPGSMDLAERLRLEQSMVAALQVLIDHPDYGGQIMPPECQPMDADPYLKSAGISADWPHGRSCYVSRDREVRVWIGEEDHLRIICMQNGTRLNDVFDRLRGVLGLLNLEYIHDEKFGYITSCPSNLGTGMRASVHVKLPYEKAVFETLGLSVRGSSGDHSPIGADGILEISPTRRLFVTEREILANLFEGLRQLVKGNAGEGT